MRQPERQTNVPPLRAEQWLEIFVPQKFREAIIGDLIEEYFNLVDQQGNNFKADIWFYKQTLKTCFYFWLRGRESNMAFLIGNLITFFIIALALVMSGHLSIFLNAPSLIMVLIPAIFLSIGATSVETLKQATLLVFNIPINNNSKNLKNIGLFFKVFGHISMLLGVLGFFIGAIAISNNFDFGKINASLFGDAFAICMLTILYALVIKVFCYIGEQKVNFISNNKLDTNK